MTHRVSWKVLAVVFLSLLLVPACKPKNDKARVLLFTKTMGFYHRSVEDGIAAIGQLGQQNNFVVDTSSDGSYFNDDSLKNYAAVVFLNTSGDVLDHYQEAAFERYIQAGGGFAGIHAAAATEFGWGWYGRLVGGYFADHPESNDSLSIVQNGILNVADTSHASTRHLPAQWQRTDEFCSFKKRNKDVKILLTVDEKSYNSDHKMGDHPMAWYHEYDGGRAFYTALGHEPESFTDSLFLQHILGGIQYAIGKNEKPDYSKAKTLPVPEENRFIKTSLVKGQIYEPTEMTILPNLDVLIAQRRGEIMLYKNGDSVVKQVGFLKVYFKKYHSDDTVEEGLLGLKADPDFEKNHFIYVFYSPLDTSVNRLSRFTFENDTIDIRSEKVILEFYSQREICCHTGGSVAFDKDGLLYVSTGDNSTPFDEPNQKYVNQGYAPLDQRPGHEQYDARRSSGNPNDLRGKILRIRVKADGSYEIPDGNLYPGGTAGTRPEIYVQGNRNPYRISVDQRNGFLYWGEVGPDAGKDSLNRGPRGYDEINQARKAGFFGWPLFVGNNYPYHEYDYNTGKMGAPFDPNHPVNQSRNNTGRIDLPPAQPAFIWYPYAASPDFPQTGTGGRTAMAGPVYYADMFPKKTRLPDYYNNKLFIYDWVRNWIKVVTMQPNGDFDKMEPFIPSVKLSAVSDMEMGPDGRLYLLEYGDGWFSKNPDAGLSRIDFNTGNRSPVVTAIHADKQTGALPLAVQFKAEAADADKDALTYTWHLGKGMTKETRTPVFNHTFTEKGDYEVFVEVKDGKGATAVSQALHLYAGNEAPVVDIRGKGNQQFYFPGKKLPYDVIVSDKEEGGMVKNAANIMVQADYIEGGDEGGGSIGHQVFAASITGKSLLQSLDCNSCHKEKEKSIGPAFFDVAKKYQNNDATIDYLSHKVIKGGGGVWGETVMPAHPDLSMAEAKQIMNWVMSLGSEATEKKSLPLQGLLSPLLDKKPVENGLFVITASYADQGATGIKAQTGSGSLVLRQGKIAMDELRNLRGFIPIVAGGTKRLLLPGDKGSLSINGLDLTDVARIEMLLGWDRPPAKDYTFEWRLNQPDGPMIGETKLTPDAKRTANRPGNLLVAVNISPVTDGLKHDLFLVIRSGNGKEESYVTLQRLELKSN